MFLYGWVCQAKPAIEVTLWFPFTPKVLIVILLWAILYKMTFLVAYFTSISRIRNIIFYPIISYLYVTAVV